MACRLSRQIRSAQHGTNGQRGFALLSCSPFVHGLTNMSESGLKPATRTEAEVRDLVRAKIRAQDAYNSLSFRNVANLTEEQRIDLEIEKELLWETLIAATRALNSP